MCRALEWLFSLRPPDKKEPRPMKQGIQSFMASAGETACYALCIIRIAEIETRSEIDPIRAMEDGIAEGWISFDWEDYRNGFNFFIHRPDLFLRMMTGKDWSIRHDSAHYHGGPGEYVVERWERAATGQTFSHFKLPDWDSLINSQTVQFGRKVSTRVFRRE